MNAGPSVPADVWRRISTTTTPLASWLSRRAVHVALLLLLPFAVYSNNYQHAYLLDDSYTIVSNRNIRSLRDIPSFFADPATYTSLREQADYRPVLQVTYALNYWMGGYATWWWHFTQILLHALVTLGIYVFCRRVLDIISDGGGHSGSVDTLAAGRIAFVAAAMFAVHPVAAGVVNYFNARSSLLTAAFLLPALIAYMQPFADAKYPRPQYRAAALYCLALFTKVEAVGAIGAFWTFDLWQRALESPGSGLGRAVRAALDRRTLRRLAPILVVTATYFVIRWHVMSPFPFDETRHAADVGPYEYLVTQLTAWWYYVLRWIAPVSLVADYQSYPVYRSWADPVVLLALGAWIAVGGLLVGLWNRAPHLFFLALVALALLSPTSSFAPLAEMVNEHRPYLPLGILSLALVIPLGQRLSAWPHSGPRTAVLASVALILVSLSALTYRRNEVFSTESRYWQDVLLKAPSSRAHLNYGLTLMRENEIAWAMRQFQRSLELAPFWHYTHINLGVAHNHLEQADSARTHFDHAVTYDRYSGMALTWRGEFRLAQRDYAGARDDFLRSQPLSLERYRNARGLATAYAALGDVERCLEQTQRMLELDSAAAFVDLPAVSRPFLEANSLRPAAIRYYAALESRLRNQSWVVERVALLGGAARNPSVQDGEAVVLAGDTARQSVSSAAVQQALMAKGLQWLTAQSYAEAAVAFKEVLALNPTHYGAHFQLAVALDRLGKFSEARVLWQKVLSMAQDYNDQTTVRAVRTRLDSRP